MPQTIKDLREMIEGFPDDAKLMFELDPNGTGHIIDMRPSYSVASGTEFKPENATDVTFYERPSAEEETKDFLDQVRLGLPEEFLALCAEHGVTPTTVLHGFIADLCELKNYVNNPRADGLSSNGSDERMYASQYYERCGYPYFNRPD